MARKWSDEVEKARGLHKRDRYVLQELGKVAGKDGRSWYRQETMAERLGMSVRTLRTALGNLELCGWIARERDWHRDGKRRGNRKADVVQLRTLAQAAAWAEANMADQVEATGGGDDGPGPGRPVEVPNLRRLDAVTSTRQPDNASTRQLSPARQAAVARRARAAADRVDQAAEAERIACEAAAAGPGGLRDLASRLKAAGHDVPADLASDDPPARRVAG